MNGMDQVDSLAWNPHKMIGAPLQSNIFVTQKIGLLADCNSASAGYLFQQDKFYDVSYDTGDKSVQCGRKVDAFQVWFMFKTRGEQYFSNAVENAFSQVCLQKVFPLYGVKLFLFLWGTIFLIHLALSVPISNKNFIG